MWFYILYQYFDDDFLCRHADLSELLWTPPAAGKEGGVTNARLGKALSSAEVMSGLLADYR
jgi:phage-related protein